MQGKVIGIVGGGQLARMLTLAAKPLGFRVVVISTYAGSPAAQVGADEIVAEGGDEAALRRLAEQVDYLTVEFEEQFEVPPIQAIANSGLPVHPAPETIELIKDKLKQKQYLRKHGIAVGPFAEITDFTQAKVLLRTYGGKMLVKTRRGGYDGNGNAVVKSIEGLRNTLEQFQNRPVYAESFVDFKKELAVMVARDINGNIKTYPVVETIHVRNICDEVLAPANISDKEQRQALRLAKRVAQHLQGAGVFGIEMFLMSNGEVLVNEIAPRVHNSGHYTIEACRTSQFEQHIRAITGLPLGSPELVVPAAAMVNVLGESNGPARLDSLDKAMAVPHTNIHMYGKSPTKIDRKMGHITATGKNVLQARKRARGARSKIKV